MNASYTLGICAAVLWSGANSAEKGEKTLDTFLAVCCALAAILTAVILMARTSDPKCCWICMRSDVPLERAATLRPLATLPGREVLAYYVCDAPLCREVAAEASDLLVKVTPRFAPVAA